ncbi:hypothetical protein [Actinomadura sp. 3N407]|uniref:hypothetical protein n=1 Tax=Actinomadura sp. 3N407 TaxID=3457423 RepID=UPI003FCEBD9C
MTDRSRSRPGLTLAAVAVVQFMVSLDLTVVNVGLPRIAAGLGPRPGLRGMERDERRRRAPSACWWAACSPSTPAGAG